MDETGRTIMNKYFFKLSAIGRAVIEFLFAD
jgi:hypothetical protein